ncbi:DUF2993 domain-containing protein [Streptomyces sp. HNM0574]|uniref:LmeA family phospholipid-binding protein n=1 Tax=Streptomyces sp. HNM0574 TaxID=2714954 RepID=UPI00146C5010|nr:DUF2993 domain-containing protein [Streptomyces sp. HNM0574]NLU67467.1 DUF2993 domain-containing protein [Streptomyces sp. HNM0574]
MISNGPSADTTAPIPAAPSAEGTGRPGEGPVDGGADRPAGPDGTGGKPRRRTVRRLVKTAGALAVVLAFLALGDRWAVLYAENMAAEKVQEALKLRAEPEVHIDSFPFLGQVAMGGLDHVAVNIPDVPAGRVSLAQVKASVDDIRIVGSLPSSVKGADLGTVRGDVFLDFDDLNREVGASQVRLTPGPERNTVLAHGELPVAGKQAEVRARAQVRRTDDHGVALTVADTKLVVPGLLTYTPGKGGGLQLTAPAAEKVDEDALQQATGERTRPEGMLKGRVLDTLVEHPSLLEPAGVDTSLLQGLQKVREPKVAQEMEFAARLPDDLPGDLGLREIKVTDEGIAAQLTGTDVRVG